MYSQNLNTFSSSYDPIVQSIYSSGKSLKTHEILENCSALFISSSLFIFILVINCDQLFILWSLILHKITKIHLVGTTTLIVAITRSIILLLKPWCRNYNQNFKKIIQRDLDCYIKIFDIFVIEVVFHCDYLQCWGLWFEFNHHYNHNLKSLRRLLSATIESLITVIWMYIA